MTTCLEILPPHILFHELNIFLLTIFTFPSSSCLGRTQTVIIDLKDSQICVSQEDLSDTKLSTKARSLFNAHHFSLESEVNQC